MEAEHRPSESGDLTELEELFGEALPLDEAARGRLLDARCGDRPALRAELEELLRHAQRPATLLDADPGRFVALAGEQPAEKAPGEIGPYRLLRELGRGGFGVVWLAEQREPIARRVALKVLQRDLCRPDTLARFEAERHLLARLDHPGIARIHDAGETDDGRPWFAMELVEGLPITQHCAERRLGLADRVRLAVEICDAVHHAHERGIVHRDLKPTNLLVTDDGARGHVKVIDFGIAKALADAPLDTLARTQAGQLVGTPAYMSPEQAAGDIAAIDARTDVHALGVVLYELLTGTLPFEGDHPTDLPGLQRRIREDDPARPSSRIAQRSATPEFRAPVLARAVRGDLDWIVVKALAKEPARRYATARTLGDDLERFLTDRPVLASPPGLRYRARKLVRRHRATAIGAGIGLAALIAGTGFAIHGLFAARRAEARAVAEADKLRIVAGFLTDTLTSANPERGLGRDVTVRQILDDAAHRLIDGTPPSIEAAVRLALGSARRALGQPTVAETELRRALTLADAQDAPERGMVRRELGLLFTDAGRFAEADALLTESLALARASGQETPVAQSLHALAILRLGQARYGDAIAALNEALALCDRPGVPDTLASAVRVTLAEALERTERYDDAERLLTHEVERATARGAPGRVRVLQAESVLALLLVRRGQAGRALPLARACVALSQEVHGPDHPETARHACNLAELLQELDQLDEAEREFRHGIEVLQRAAPDGSPAEASARGNLGWLLSRTGRDDEAETELRASLETQRRLLGNDNPGTATALSDLAALLRSRGRFADAEAAGNEALQIFERVLGERHRSTAVAAHSLGVTIHAAGDAARAAPILEQALELGLATMPTDGWELAEFRKRLARAWMDLGRFDDARQQFELAHAAMLAQFGPDHRRTISTIKGVIDVALETGDWDRAAAWRARLPEAERGYAVEAERNLREARR
ncbi:MAG: serine/threonine protein kinase [Planctomycetes bacterium]|nr:serine/threonine protein kinase [Planctomycetota bacterium]